MPKSTRKPEVFTKLISRLEKAKGFALYFAVTDDPLFQRAFVLATKAELKRPVVEVEISPAMDIPLSQFIAERLEEASDSPVALVYSPDLFISNESLKIGGEIFNDMSNNQGKYILLRCPLLFIISPVVRGLITALLPEIFELVSAEFLLPSFLISELEFSPFFAPQEPRQWVDLFDPLRKGLRGRSPEARRDKATLDYVMGVIFLHLREFAKARKLLRKSRECFRELGDARLQRYPWMWLMKCELETNHFAQARKLAEEYRDYTEKFGTNDDLAFAITLQYLIESAEGNLEKARQFLLEALDMASDDSQQRGMILDFLGDLSDEMGELEEAVEWYQEALEFSREFGYKAREAETLYKLGGVLAELGRTQEAIEAYRDALKLHRQLDGKPYIAETAYALAYTLNAEGDFKEAEKFAKEALYTARRIGYQERAADALLMLGKIASEKGELEQAKSYYLEAKAEYEELEDPLGMARVLTRLGELAADEGEYEQAKEFITQALKLAPKVKDEMLHLRAIFIRGFISFDQGRFGDARRWFEKFLEKLEAVELPEAIRNDLETYVLNALTKCYVELDRLEESLEASKRLLELNRKRGNAAVIILNLLLIGDIYADQEKWEEAEAAFNEALDMVEEFKGERADYLKAQVHINLARLKTSTGAFEEAIEHLNQIRELDVKPEELPQEIQMLEKLLEQKAAQSSETSDENKRAD